MFMCLCGLLLWFLYDLERGTLKLNQVMMCGNNILSLHIILRDCIFSHVMFVNLAITFTTMHKHFSDTSM